MNIRFLHAQRGLSLIELSVVLAILGVLAAIVVPNVGGFFGAGQEQSYLADQQTLQTSANSFRTDAGNVGNLYPTIGNFNVSATDSACAANTKNKGLGIGKPATDCNSYVDIAALVNGSGSIPGGFLQSTDSVKSAWRDALTNATTGNATATNTPVGSYGWYVDENGLVKSNLKGDNTKLGFQNVFP